jgi:GNAT superfamily N-acetyltransferase
LSIAIRPANTDDGPALQDIERRAGARFREIGMPEVADDEPASVEKLADYAREGRAWVAIDASGPPVGYVLVDVLDGCAHVEQVSVLPEQQGKGVGRALLDHVKAWGTGEGHRAVTLSTFSDVPWNRPLYEHLGFRVLAEDDIGPGLRAVRDEETRHGLDPTTRVCMKLSL